MEEKENKIAEQDQEQDQELKPEVPEFHTRELSYMISVMLDRVRAPKEPDDLKMALLSTLRFSYMLLEHKEASDVDRIMARTTCWVVIEQLRNDFPLEMEVPRHDWN